MRTTGHVPRIPGVTLRAWAELAETIPARGIAVASAVGPLAALPLATALAAVLAVAGLWSRRRGWIAWPAGAAGLVSLAATGACTVPEPFAQDVSWRSVAVEQLVLRRAAAGSGHQWPPAGLTAVGCLAAARDVAAVLDCFVGDDNIAYVGAEAGERAPTAGCCRGGTLLTRPRRGGETRGGTSAVTRWSPGRSAGAGWPRCRSRPDARSARPARRSSPAVPAPAARAPGPASAADSHRPSLGTGVRTYAGSSAPRGPVAPP